MNRGGSDVMLILSFEGLDYLQGTFMRYLLKPFKSTEGQLNLLDLAHADVSL